MSKSKPTPVPLSASGSGPEEEPTAVLSSISILWFRHGLRTHDNPALIAALRNKTSVSSRVEQSFMPIFIFDGESAGMELNLGHRDVVCDLRHCQTTLV